MMGGNMATTEQPLTMLFHLATPDPIVVTNTP